MWTAPAVHPRIGGWELTQAISPRPRVRVADVDAYGRTTNEYTRTASIAGEQPGSTWAVHLADNAGRFTLLGFDLDAAKGRPSYDAAKLTIWLRDLGIPYLVAASGPTGGRHVWVGLTTPVPAATVAAIARLAKQELPSLDLSPLTNPTTGCVRPPGAPHRDGGESTVLEGTIGTLTHPTVGAEAVDELLRYLVELTGGFREPRPPVRAENISIDREGHPYLSRGTRALSPGSQKLIADGRPTGDASALLASALARCAHAGMTLAEVLELAPSSPAFRHAYSARTGTHTRTARHSARARAIIERQWTRTVEWVATSPKAFTGDDPTFDERAAALVELVQSTQSRADAAPGRWARSGAGPAQSAGTGRYSDRLVLDGLCLLALRAVSATVEASDRTLALLAGVGRETARTALLRLQDEGWIAQATPADGPRAAHWQLQSFSTGNQDWDRSQVPPPPGIPAAALRNSWISLLERKIEATRHDVFAAPRSLGRTAGRIYAQLADNELRDALLIAARAGLPAQSTRRALHRLAAAGLTIGAHGLWQRPEPDLREMVARAHGVDGYLEQRARRYDIERQAWAWWQAELEHRHANRAGRRRRRRADQPLMFGRITTVVQYPIHPKRKDGRADFAAAHQAIAAGLLTTEDLAA